MHWGRYDIYIAFKEEPSILYIVFRSSAGLEKKKGAFVSCS